MDRPKLYAACSEKIVELRRSARGKDWYDKAFAMEPALRAFFDEQGVLAPKGRKTSRHVTAGIIASRMHLGETAILEDLEKAGLIQFTPIEPVKPIRPVRLRVKKGHHPWPKRQ